MSNNRDSQFPFRYIDGPDYCTVKDAQDRDFALTMQPELMKALERALCEEIKILSRKPAEMVERLRKMPSSLNDACRTMEQAAALIERAGVPADTLPGQISAVYGKLDIEDCATADAHLKRIITGLFNPMPDRHPKGCLANENGPCICGYAEVAGEYLWALREAKKIAAEHFGQEAVDQSRRLEEPHALVEAALTRVPAQCSQEPSAYLRDEVREDDSINTEVCDKGDPGAYPVYRAATPSAQGEMQYGCPYIDGDECLLEKNSFGPCLCANPVAQCSPDHIEIKRLNGLLADAQRIIAEYQASTTAGAKADVAAHGMPGAQRSGGCGASQKDEMLAFFLAFFEGWEPGTKLTLHNMESLERARATVAALSLPSTSQLTAAPLDLETPECSICGARVFDPCRTLERAAHCELPPGVVVSSTDGATR